MNAEGEASGGRWAFGLTVTAFAWSMALVIAAVFLPVYGATQSEGGSGMVDKTTTTTSTLFAETGVGLAGLVALLTVVLLPAVSTALVWFCLHRRCSRGSRSSGYLAWALVGVLWAFSLLAVFDLGLFLMPVALLLTCAAILTPTAARAAGGSTRG